MSRTQLQAAVDRLEKAHRRIKEFTDDLTPAEGFWHPAAFTPHAAREAGDLSGSGDKLCLPPRHGFADGRGKPTSAGVGGALGTRNAPTVLNAAFLASQFWDGRAPTL